MSFRDRFKVWITLPVYGVVQSGFVTHILPSRDPVSTEVLHLTSATDIPLLSARVQI